MSESVNVRDERRREFFIVDNAIIAQYGRTIGPYGIAVYNALAMHAGRSGRCNPSVLTIANEIGASKRAVQGAIATLTEAGLLDVEVQPSGPTSTNAYILNTVGAPGACGAPPPDALGAPGACGAPKQEETIPPFAKAQGGTDIPAPASSTPTPAAPTPKASTRSARQAKPPKAKADPTRSATSREILEAITEIQGFPVAGWARNRAGVNVMLDQGYTSDEIVTAWRLCIEEGWHAEHYVAVTAQYVDKKIGPLKVAGKLSAPTHTDTREPAARYFARRGTSMSDPAAWTPEARALYPEDAAAWAPAEAAR